MWEGKKGKRGLVGIDSDWAHIAQENLPGFNYCSVQIKDEKIRSDLRENCGLPLINILNAL